MAAGQKPYRVYRGGRVKGKVPLERRVREEERERRLQEQPPAGGRPGAPPRTRPRRRWSRGRWIAVGLIVLVVLLVIWTVAGYLSVRSGVGAANKRLPADVDSTLTSQDGLLLSKPSTILLLGTDHSKNASRAADRHSDSIMLLRTDPGHHRLYYLSIPRDLAVDVPGHGQEKVNAAMQFGGPALAIRTLREFTGLPINHVVVVDFGAFEKLIDKVGGIDVNVPENILSNRFDCPYATAARCQQWQGWSFRKGTEHMSGHRALIYSRIRENRLDPSESDITRGQRQQDVLQALLGKIASVGMWFKLPFVGGDLLRPITTDLSTNQLVQLGWVKFRAGSVVRCRLGGDLESSYLGSIIHPTPENRSVILTLTGDSAPQPPAPGSGPYGPGCVTGGQRFK
jgi:LCP family protein required for cell wall assembly